MSVPRLFSKAERASGVTESSALAKPEFAKTPKKLEKTVKGWGKLGSVACFGANSLIW
ncbi:MAG: hypothetical protein ACJAVO_002461 [Parvibaculaceae bacterium]|jgi:hypothetical protein